MKDPVPAGLDLRNHPCRGPSSEPETAPSTARRRGAEPDLIQHGLRAIDVGPILAARGAPRPCRKSRPRASVSGGPAFSSPALIASRLVISTWAIRGGGPSGHPATARDVVCSKLIDSQPSRVQARDL